MIPIKTDKRSLEDFGKTLTIVLFLLSSFWSYRGSEEFAGQLLYGAFFFSFVSLFVPRSIKYLYIYWIKAANIISNIMTKVILFLVYFAFVTPYSLLVKLFKGDLLDKKLDPTAETYWKTRPKTPINLDQYERQF